MIMELPDNPKNLISLECHCGEFHIIDISKPTWNYFYQQLATLGEFTTIEVLSTGKKYKVQRLYIAVHGIKAKDIPILGFKEV